MGGGQASLDGIEVFPAEFDDLKAILALQYIAYQSEAKLVNNPSIPPLRETLDDIEAQYREGTVFLKAADSEGVIIGSVRGREENGTLYIGKLIVHPEQQGKGIGSLLLREMETHCPLPRYELFTSDKSVRNISLYERLGYMRFEERQIAPDLRFIYLEKLKANNG